jgi:lipoate-protein ligase A
MSFLKSKKLNSFFVESTSFDPWLNLAIEEYLVEHVKEDEVILYLWQNKDTVVIGSNQNPWKECNIEKMKDGGIKLARRLSGGGAVFHDVGNLNFTFVMGKDLYNQEKQLNVILKAVNSFGFNAEFSGRNDILIDGRKFSGNAYFFGDNSSYHHGTLLVDADMLKLSEYLNPSKQKIISKGVDSVRSRVINLKELNGNITIEDLKSSVLKSFQESYCKIESHKEYTEDAIKDEELRKLYDKYSSWQWLYAESPSFDDYYENRFSWGEVQIGLNFVDGYIKKVKVYSDAMNTTFVDKLVNVLTGVKYDNRDIHNAIRSAILDDDEKQIFIDISSMFE